MRFATLSGNLLATFIVITLAAPCFGYDLRIKDAPNWVNDGTIYTTVQGERYFYGVGSSPVVGDPDLQKAISKSRATSEAKRILTAWLDALAADYLKSKAAKSNHADSAAVQNQLKSFANAMKERLNLAARWKDPRTGSLYSLALLDMTTMKSAAAESQLLDEAIREHIQKHGSKLFDRVKRSSKKRPHRPK